MHVFKEPAFTPAQRVIRNLRTASTLTRTLRSAHDGETHINGALNVGQLFLVGIEQVSIRIFDLFAGQRINDGYLDLVEGLDCQIVVVTDEGKAKRSLDAFETVWERIHQRL